MRSNCTPASLQADTNGLVQQARSKRFNKTSKASAISTTESAASRGAKNHSNQTLKSYICANSPQNCHLARIKCQMTNMTKDYIISIISSGHRCAAVDLSISILLLPPAVLHNKADNSPLGNQQSEPKEGNCQRLLETVDFNHERCDGQFCLLLDGLSDTMANYLQWQTISKPRKCTQQKPAQQFDALLLSPGLS